MRYLPVFLLAAMALPSQASLTSVPLFRSEFFTQATAAPPTTLTGVNFDVRGFMTVGDFDLGTITYPGPGSPGTLTVQNPTTLDFQQSFATQAAMDAAFPFGTYVVQASNSLTGTVQTVSVPYTRDAYPGSIPALTPATFNALGTFDPAQVFNFGITPYVTGGIANQSFVFLTITKTVTNAIAFNQAFLPPNTTSISLPANTLTPGTAYSFRLDFSNRDTPASGIGDRGFDFNTLGGFTTAAASTVPEPGGMALASLGLAGLIYVSRRRAA